MRTYSELMSLKTFEERFRYLKLSGAVGEESFGFERYLNQGFYKSYDWRHIRNRVIVRDHGLDLGFEGREIPGRIIVHHMNPIRPEDIRGNIELILNPEYLISTCHVTHNAIHYGDESILYQDPIVRTPGDTKLW